MARPDSPDERDLFPYVNLRRARLCLDCEMIFEGPRCPACTSESFVPITRWIRPTDRPVERRVESPPAPPKPRHALRKTLYVGLGAYGAWKMLFEPAKPRKRTPAPPKEQKEPKA